MSTEYVIQTTGQEKYTALFERALAHGRYDRIEVAVAYATLSGVRVIERLFRRVLGDDFGVIEKRWLVGIDWCRSDPAALERLVALGHSQVRVPNGAILVGRAGCHPDRPYHPKTFILIGDRHQAIICGSGNLSASGLTRGCECGSVFLSGGADPIGPELEKLRRWFQTTWIVSDRFSEIRNAYDERYKRLVRENKAYPTDDDVKPIDAVPGRRGLSDLQIRQLRTYGNFWIGAGSLGSNLGHGVPGNQLDMTRYSRVFFGAPLSDVPPNTIIDTLVLKWNGEVHRDRTLKFGTNGMDKLNVPVPGSLGQLYYRGKTLLFSRNPDGSFTFKAGGPSECAQWRRYSQHVNANYALPGGRPWGVF